MACPLLDFMRQSNASLLISVLIWVINSIIIPLAIVQQQYERLLVFGLYIVPVFILCLAGTLRAVPAATSVPAEEKRRIVGTLVLLQLNYFVLILPALSLSTFVRNVSLAMMLLSPLVDLILFFFMQKGPIDCLLSRLCCCSSMASTGTAVSSTSAV